MPLGLNLSLGLASSQASGPPTATIQLSGQSVSESATIGTTIGALSVSNGSGSYTFTETADPDSKFTVSGSNLNTSAALNYEAATSHSVTVQADNGTDAPITRTFTISVTNVFEQPDLSALSGSFSLAEGAAQGTSAGSISGKTSGSTLSLIDNAGGRVQLSGTTVQAGPTATDYEAATSHSFTVRETLADSSNSPRDTVLSLTVTDVDEIAPTITSANPSGTYEEGVAVSGTLTANETVTWSKSGTDASRVTLNTSTGAWSLESTDYETKTSHSWTFTATDTAGNTASQVVAIAIADVVDEEPAIYSLPGALWDYRDLSSGAVSSWGSRDGFQTLAQSTSGNQPAKDADGVDFDGTADILFDTARSFAHISTNDLGNDIISTGLARAGDGTWWIADQNGTGNDGQIHNYSPDFSTRLATIDLGPIYGTGNTTRMQGLVYDNTDDTLWFAAKGYVRHISISGSALAGDIAFPTDPGGLALDEANGVLIIMQNELDGTTIRKVDKTTGATLTSSTISVSDRDHLFFHQASRALFLTSGANGSAGSVSIYSIDGANFMDLIATVSVPELDAIEGLVYHDDKLYVCNDANFHGGATNLNAVMVFDAPGIVGTQVNIFGVISFSSVTPTDAVLVIGNPVGSDSYGHGLYTAGTTTLQLRAHSGGTGTGTATRSFRDFTSVPDLTSPRIVFGQIDTTADTFRLWVDGTEVATGTTTGDLATYVGPVTDRARLNLGASYEGANTRHLPLTTKAIGYSLVQQDRAIVEGWLAHEFGLTANLPSDHPYKVDPPLVDPGEVIAGATVNQPGPTGTIYEGFTLAWGDDFNTAPTFWNATNQTAKYSHSRAKDGKRNTNIEGGKAISVHVDSSYRGHRHQLPVAVGDNPFSVTDSVLSITDKLPSTELAAVLPPNFTNGSGGQPNDRPPLISGGLFSWPSFMFSQDGDFIIEGRHEMPPGVANGAWASFWFSSLIWPDHGEFDIFEMKKNTSSGAPAYYAGNIIISLTDGGAANYGTRVSGNYTALEGRMVHWLVKKSGSVLTLYTDEATEGTLALIGTLDDPTRVDRFRGGADVRLEFPVNLDWDSGTYNAAHWPKTVRSDWLRAWVPNGTPLNTDLNVLGSSQVQEGGSWSYTIPANSTLFGTEVDFVELSGAYSDADNPGQSGSSSITSGGVRSTGLPEGMTFNWSTRTLAGTIPMGSAGRTGVLFVGSFSGGGASRRAIRFWDVAPVVEATLFGNSTVDLDGTLSIDIAYTDFHSGNLGPHTYTVSSDKSWAVVTMGEDDYSASIAVTAPSTAETATITIAATNTVGQTTTVTRTIAAQDASTAQYVTYDVSTDLAPTSLAGVTASNITNSSVSPLPILDIESATLRAASASTTLSNAISLGRYFYVTLQGTGKKVTNLNVIATRGGATTARSFAVRTNVDSYAADIMNATNIPSQYPSWTTYDEALDIDISSTVTFRFYISTGNSSATNRFDQLRFKIEDA